MLRFAQAFLFGASRAPHQPLADLDGRERAILVILVAAVFYLGLFPAGALRMTEQAALQYRELVADRIATPQRPVAAAGGLAR
jgi:NADH:ubiquinone oxidoreductase subunit 4 (subunit M)